MRDSADVLVRAKAPLAVPDLDGTGVAVVGEDGELKKGIMGEKEVVVHEESKQT